MSKNFNSDNERGFYERYYSEPGRVDANLGEETLTFGLALSVFILTHVRDGISQDASLEVLRYVNKEIARLGLVEKE